MIIVDTLAAWLENKLFLNIATARNRYFTATQSLHRLCGVF